MINGNQPMTVTSFICPDGCLWTGALRTVLFKPTQKPNEGTHAYVPDGFNPAEKRNVGGIVCTYIYIYIIDTCIIIIISIITTTIIIIIICIYILSLHTRYTYVIMNLKWCSFYIAHQVGQLETNHAASPWFSGLCGSEHESAKINGLKPVWYIYIYTHIIYYIKDRFQETNQMTPKDIFPLYKNPAWV